MSKTTPSTRFLDKAGVKYEVHTYDYDPTAQKTGMQAAEAIGADPERVLKTLMAEVDGKAVCAVMPSNHEVSMKKLAHAFSGKSAEMMKPADAERFTGFHVGGISPFGQRKRVPTVFEATVMAHETVFMNGGQRGLQVNLKPADAVKALGATVVDLLAE